MECLLWITNGKDTIAIAEASAAVILMRYKDLFNNYIVLVRVKIIALKVYSYL